VLAAVAAGDAVEAKEHYQRLENQRGNPAGLADSFSVDRLLGLLVQSGSSSVVEHLLPKKDVHFANAL